MTARPFDAVVCSDDGVVDAVWKDESTISTGKAGTNDSTVLKAAVDAVHASGGGVIKCIGDYKQTSVLYLHPNIHLEGAGAGHTIFDASKITQSIGNAYGYTGVRSTLVSDVYAGNTHIHLSPGLGALYRVGDIVKLYDTKRAHPLMSSTRGELLEIQSVDNDTVTFTTVIRDNYDVKTYGARIEKINMADNIRISGIRIIGPGIETSSNAIWLWTTRNFLIDNCTLEYWGTSGVQLYDTMDALLFGCRFKHIMQTGMGYAIELCQANTGARIDNCTFRGRGRRYIATGGGWDDISQGGILSDVNINGCYFEATVNNQTAIDAHECTAHYTKVNATNNTINSCGMAIEVKNGSLYFAGNTVLNCPQGVVFAMFTTPTDYEYRTQQIVNNRFINTGDISGIYGIIGYGGKHIKISGNELKNSIIQISGSNISLIDNDLQFAPAFGPTTGLKISLANNLKIAGNTLEYSQFLIDTCTSVMVQGNTFLSNATTNSGINIASCNDLLFEGNFINNMANGAMWITRMAGDHRILNNTFNTCNIGIFEGAGAVAGSRLFIDGNIYRKVTTPVLSVTVPEFLYGKNIVEA